MSWGAGKRVVMLIADGFEDREAVEPKEFLEDAGAEVTVAGLEVRSYHGKRGAILEADADLRDLRPDDFDLLLIPGGRAPAELRRHQEVADFVRGYWALSRPVAAICHGPQVLITAGLVDGVRATSWPAVKDELIAAGAIYADEEAVVDGNLVTSRSPRDIPAFNRSIGQLLQSREAADTKR